MTEEWKSVLGFEFYECSNLGYVRSWKNNKWGKSKKPKLLKFSFDSNGYPRVSMSNNGIQRPIRIHRIVADLFLPKVEGKYYVNHIDANPKNNCITNLEWCTQKENVNHCIRMGRSCIGELQPGSKLKEYQIKEIRLLNKKLSFNKIAKQYSVTATVISKIIKGKSWSHVI